MRAGLHALIDPADLEGAADDTIDDDADLAALRAAFEKGPYADRLPVAVEAPFELVLGGVVVRSRIDAVFSTPPPRYYKVLALRPTGRRPRNVCGLPSTGRACSPRHIPVSDVDAAFVYVRTGQVDRHGADLPDEQGLLALLSADVRSP